MTDTAANETKKFEGITQSQYMSDPFGENAASLNTAEDDRKLHVRFYMEPVYQEAQSILSDPPRKIYKDTEYIEIRIPGDKQTCIQRQVFPSDLIRFSQQYARFKQGQADQTIGTPLSTLPSIPESKIKEYEFFHIRTVEQLAECADNANAAAVMGFQADKQKAVKFMEAAAGAAPVEALKQQLAEKDKQFAAMQEQLNQLMAERSVGAEKATAKAK